MAKLLSIELPIIDFDKIEAGDEAKANEGQKIVDAFTKYGFCLIANVPNYSEEQVNKAIK